MRCHDKIGVVAFIAHYNPSAVCRVLSMSSAMRGVLYADDPGVLSRSQTGLALMTETMCLRAPDKKAPGIAISATDQIYKQKSMFVYLGGAVHENAGIH